MLEKGHLGDRLDTSFGTGNTYLIIFFFLVLFLNSPFFFLVSSPLHHS